MNPSKMKPDKAFERDVGRLYVVIGTGKRLFGEGTIPRALRLADTQQPATGAVLHVYERAGSLKYGEVEVGQETVIYPDA